MARGRKSAWRIVLSPEERTIWHTGNGRPPSPPGSPAGGDHPPLAAGTRNPTWPRPSGSNGMVVCKWARAVPGPAARGPRRCSGPGSQGQFSPAEAIHVVRLACERPDTVGS